MLSRYSYLILAGLSVLSKTVNAIRIQMNQPEHVRLIDGGIVPTTFHLNCYTIVVKYVNCCDRNCVVRSLQQFNNYPSWIINFPEGQDAQDAMEYFCRVLEVPQEDVLDFKHPRSYCSAILTKYKFAETFGTEGMMRKAILQTEAIYPMLGPIYLEEDEELTLSNIQEKPPRNLDIITLPLNDQYEYKCTGKGTHLYVLDTGVRYDHDDFSMPDQLGSRVVNEYSIEPNVPAISDCQGHGTHISSIAAGLTYGVAKNATIHAVKIFGCSTVGRMSSLLAGLEAIGDNMEEQSVILLSMGGKPSQSLESTLRRMDDEGIVVVGSAGNQNSDACEFSPSFIDTVLSVGATSNDGARLTGRNGLGSNFGSCVDVYAPGEQIEAASNDGRSGTRFLSGTSQSAPHAAGVALLLREKFPDASPAEIRETIRDNLVDGILQVPKVDCTIEAQQIDAEQSGQPFNGFFELSERQAGVPSSQQDSDIQEEQPKRANGLFTRQVSQRAKTKPAVEYDTDDSDTDSDTEGDDDGGRSGAQPLWQLYSVQNTGGLAQPRLT